LVDNDYSVAVIGPLHFRATRISFSTMASFAESSDKRDLFGGAIETSLRAEYADVSDVRQVPDHQEVFIHKDNEVSIIVELLQYDDELPDTLVALRHYYDDLVEVNEATENKVLNEAVLSAEDSFLPNLDKDVVKMAVVGKQTVGKFRTRPGMQVDHIYLVFILVRLVSVGTELFISMNIPSAAILPPQKEGAEPLSEEVENAALLELESRMNVQQLLDSSAYQSEDVQDSLGTCFKDLRTLLSNFKINDWSLFGGEDPSGTDFSQYLV